MASPFLVGFLVEIFGSNNAQNKNAAYLYAGGILLIFTLSLICRHAAFFSLECLGLKLRTALTELVYQKVLAY